MNNFATAQALNDANIEKGGIGYGRIRLSLLFRSIKIILPPQQLGWDVGTFEVNSNTLVTTGYKSLCKIKLRTGGSSGKIPRSQCQRTEQEDGVQWNIPQNNKKYNIRLPVKYRYRSPVVFEFHIASKHGVDAYAVIWLDHLKDNITQDFRIPIWRTDKGTRLTQNHITEHNLKEVIDLKVEELGYLIFTGGFKSGIDPDHKQFIADNNSRETHETWEACFSEGQRNTNIMERTFNTKNNSNDSLVISNRDTLSSRSKHQKQEPDLNRGVTETEKSGLNTKLDEGSSCSPSPITDIDEGSSEMIESNSDFHNGEDNSSVSESSSCFSPSSASRHDKFDEDSILDQGQISENVDSRNPLKQIKLYREKKDILHRTHRGLMQWKPIRNLDFVKNETKFLVRRTLNKSKLQAKQSDLETEV